jgi:pSer/pThr/pTyr-binding forkhead associated (FHA) protein
MARSWTIGSKSECDLVVDSARVSGHHCRLWRDESGYSLEDLGSTNGTYVNGVRLTGPVRVARGDSITLGVTTPMPWPPESDAPGSRGTSPAPELPRTEPVLGFHGAAMVIGRAADCDHVLDVPMVSSHHARLYRTFDGDWIEDLGSANGTFVNGRRVEGKVAVKSGDAINLGTYSLVLSVAPRDDVILENLAPIAQPQQASTAPSASVATLPLLALLLALAPLAGILIVLLLGRNNLESATPEGAVAAARATAAMLFWLGLAAIGFGLCDVLLVKTSDAQRLWNALVADGAVMPGFRLLVLAVLGVLQCLLAWGIVALAESLKGPGLSVLALLILSAAVGLALGLLIGAVSPRPEVGWRVAAPVVIVLALLGGGVWPLARMPELVRFAAGAVPSRWAFEGLLLLEAGRAPAAGGHDLAEDAFPADSERMGVQADVMALLLMGLGLGGVAGFIEHERVRVQVR